MYDFIYPQCCLIKNNSNFTRVESKCETTVKTIIFTLTGKFDEFRVIEDLTLDNIMHELYKWNMIEINISCRNNFGGHDLLIIRDDDVFYIIQSYIFEYNLKINIANEEQIELYINNYLKIFNSNNLRWTKDDIELWKCLTGVDLPPELNDIKPRMFILWWYSYPQPFNINIEKSQTFIRNLLYETLMKIKKTKYKYIKDIFGDSPVEEIEDDIEQLIADLDLLYVYNDVIKLGHVTDSGCLIIELIK